MTGDPSATTDPRAALIERLRRYAVMYQRTDLDTTLTLAADALESVEARAVAAEERIEAVRALCEAAIRNPLRVPDTVALIDALAIRAALDAPLDTKQRSSLDEALADRSERDQARSIAAALEAENARLVAQIQAVRALHEEHEDMARVLNNLTVAEKVARQRCRPGQEMGDNARAMYVAHGSPMRCRECNKPAPCPTCAALTSQED